MFRAESNGEMLPESKKEWRKFFSTPGRNHYVVMTTRVGAANFCQDLENKHYPPKTHMNSLLHLRLCNWSDIRWFIVSIPSADHAKAESAAAANGLRIIVGIPTVISNLGAVQFPIQGDNVYAIENVPGHPVYKHRKQR